MRKPKTEKPKTEKEELLRTLQLIRKHMPGPGLGALAEAFAARLEES